MFSDIYILKFLSFWWSIALIYYTYKTQYSGISKYLKTLSFKKNPIIISVDGNIGSGKSTFIKILKEVLPENQVEFACEPVDVWTSVSDDNGKNLLGNFYEDKDRWSYTFQNFAYITRLMELDRAKNTGKPIIITERSVLTDRHVFAKMLNEAGHINKLEMEIYRYWYDYFDARVTHTVYLKTSVDNCLTRIKKRAREAESSISGEYLKELETEHDNWLLDDTESTVLDGNLNFIGNDGERDILVNLFKKCITKLQSR